MSAPDVRPWRYRCSLCGELLRPGAEITAHVEDQSRPDWPGVMKLDRVDDDGEP